jgi:hypothetical protein
MPRKPLVTGCQTHRPLVWAMPGHIRYARAAGVRLKAHIPTIESGEKSQPESNCWDHPRGICYHLSRCPTGSV